MATPSREKVARGIMKQRNCTTYKSNKRDATLKQRECGWNDHFLTPVDRSDMVHDTSSKVKHDSLTAAHSGEIPGPESRCNPRGGLLNKVKHQRPRKTPPNGKLEPIQQLQPIREAEREDSQLRRRATASIEYREEIINQLRDFIACIPLKARNPPKGLVLGGAKPHQSLPPNVKPKDVTNIIKQISTELQVAGIRCVESIVAWMLHHGKASETPPVFVWKDENYFVHMYSDLDFLVDELKSRGVPPPPEFTKSNPLLMNANQRLGRICAAQAIILEMVEMANANRPTSASSSPKSKASVSRVKTPRIPSAKVNTRLLATDNKPCAEEVQDTPLARTIDQASALDLIHAKPTSASDSNHEEECRGEHFHAVATPNEENLHERAVNDAQRIPNVAPQVGKDAASAATSIREDKQEELDLRPDTSYQDVNDFEEYLDDTKSQDGKTSDANVDDTSPIETNHQKQSSDDDQLESPRQDRADDAPSQVTRHISSWQDELAQAQVPANHIAALRSCLDPDQWDSSSVLQALSDVRSFFTANAVETMCQVEKNLHIVSTSVVECVDTAMGPVLASMQRFVSKHESSAAEIDIDDVLEALSSAVARHEPDELLAVALEVGQHLSTLPSMDSRLRATKTCDAWRCLYPFIMSAPRKSISNSCRQAVDALASIVDFEKHPYFLDYLGKGVLLLACAASDPATNTSTVSKLSVVCDRIHPMTSSMKHIDQANAWTCVFDLYPFFSCAYGEKVVNQTRVEAGEGRGPLKEWFSLLSHEFSTAWARSAAPASNLKLKIRNRTVTAASLVDAFGVEPGHRLDIQMPDGAPISCRVTRVLDNDAVLVDQVLSTVDMFVDSASYTWFTPQVPLLVYVQASESYFLNESTDRAMTKQLEFLGWLLAMAIYHQATLDGRLNIVLFDLLLGAEFTIDKIEALDQSLYKSWMQLREMENFQAFLEMEELPTTMSASEYIDHTLQEKSTKISWQVEAIKRGFANIVPLAAVNACKMSPQDLQQLVHGEPPTESIRLRSIFLVSMDKELEDSKCFRDAFWEVIDGMAPSDQRKFVKFVTGINKLPSPGTEFLRIEVPFTAIGASERKKQLVMLPQSHTCDNILELPNYWAGLRESCNGEDPPYDDLVALLRCKLLYAIENGGDYGLDVAGATGSTGRAMPDAHETHEASTDSLQLPSLLDDTPDSAELPAHSPAPESDDSDPVETIANMPAALPHNSSTIELLSNAAPVEDDDDKALELTATDGTPRAQETHDDDEYSFDDFEEQA